MIVSLLTLLYLGMTPGVNTYSRGAPDTACRDHMMPRHGFDVQVNIGLINNVERSQYNASLSFQMS